MRSPCQVVLLAVLMASLIMPPGLFAAGGPTRNPAKPRSILLVGDSLSVGLGQQLAAAYAGSPDVRFDHLGKVSSGLARPDFFDWPAHLTSLAKAHQPDVVLIMVGANDDKPLPVAGGHAAFGTRDWDAAYAVRLSRLHAIVRAANPRARVYYIGVPVMGSAAFDASVRHINGVLQRTARSLPDASYIDTRDVLAAANGEFAPMAKGTDGSVVKLRTADGVHITATGSRLVAARCLSALGADAGACAAQVLARLDTRWQPVGGDGTAKAPVVLAQAKAAPAVVKPATTAKPVVVADGTPVAPTRPKTAASKPVAAPAPRIVTASAAKPVIMSTAIPATVTRTVSHGGRAAASRVHTVAEGDNYWSVARGYAVSVAALTEANPGVDPARLRIGQSLTIPGAAIPAASQGYVVAEGDNFWAISRHLGVDMDALKQANTGVDPMHLHPGQVLSLPGTVRAEASSPAPAAGQGGRAATMLGDAGLYPVSKGDTLWSLSRRFGVSLDTLLAANRDLDPSRLRVGQLVTIPSGAQLASADVVLFPVASGDTLESIARRFDVAVDTLIAANPGIDPLHLHQGQMLRVPSSLAAVAASAGGRPVGSQAASTTPALPVEAVGRRHIVTSGDTIWDLARHYGLPVERLLAANTGIDPARLRVGQTLAVPDVLVSMAAR